MIHEVTGDILLSRADAIAHGVAPDDHFDRGLALALRERWPSMARDFCHFCFTNSPKPGDIWAWAGVGGVRIVNLMTQKAPDHHRGHPGRAHTEWVNACLHNLRHWVVEEKITSIALPRLATGVGGLDWDDVYPIIQRQLGNLDIPVLIYTNYRPGEAAVEPGVAEPVVMTPV